MKKTKLKLTNLEVASFKTSEEMKGGFIVPSTLLTAIEGFCTKLNGCTVKYDER